MIREFAIFIALGVLFALVITITFIPAVLSLLKVKKTAEEKKLENIVLIRFMDRLGSFVLRKEKLIILFATVIAIVAVLGIFRLKREVNMLEYFDKKHEIRTTEKMMQDKFGGSIPIQILVKGDIKNPFVLKEMMKIEKFLKTLPDVNDPQSIADLVCEMNDVMNDRYTIPETREGVANLWFFIEGQDILDQLVDSGASQAIIQTKLGTVDTKKIVTLVDKINAYLDKNVKNGLIEMSLDAVPLPQRKLIEKERIADITANIRMDIKGRFPDYAGSEDKFEDILYRDILEKNNQISASGILKIKEKINDFLLNNESDIELTSSKIVNKITHQISKNLKQGTLSAKKIAGILKSNINRRDILEEEYVELIGLTTESIEHIIDVWKKKDRVDILTVKIKGALPKQIQEDKKILKKIRDDLWSVNETMIALSGDEYSRIIINPESFTPIFTGLSMKQTGMSPIFKNLDEQIVKSQIQSLIIATFLVFILLAVQMKSIVGGLIGIIPIILTVLINFGVMAYSGLALDVCTVLIGSVAVGIGIDYSIHFLSRFKSEFKQNKTPLEALDKTLETTGVAILINAISVSTGFLVLLLGNLRPLRQFGWLMALTMLTSAWGAITVLPAVILVSHSGFIGRFNNFSNNMAVKIKAKIMKGRKKNEKN
ncbi:MAG: hypothetical protein CVU78_05375 [Elusimicrobia bacterium HGW-Elusimicrobia-2]|nr:MAG: hypothetical protein CVU78_05375 [Elusimicrobia bacterium HGW-Elusimicrobia-2]